MKRVLWFLAAAILSLPAAWAEDPGLLSNGTFESVKGAAPEGWEFINFRTGGQGRLAEGEGGGRAVAIRASDRTQRGCWRQRVRVTGGDVLLFTARYRTAGITGSAGDTGAVVRFTYLKSERGYDFLSDVRRGFAPSEVWADARALVPVPAGAVDACVELFNFFAPGEVAWSRIAVRKATDAERAEALRTALDRAPSGDQLDYRPAEGATVTVTPAPFVWVPVPGAAAYALQYSRERTFPEDRTTTVRGIGMSVYTPREVMAAGTWYWRYGVDSEKPVFSRARAFTLAADAVQFPYPDVEKAFARIPASHPRLYARAEQVAALRTAPEYQALREGAAGARKLIGQPMHPEPAFLPSDASQRGKAYKEIFAAERPFVGGMENLAFAYLLTGDRACGEEAKRRLLHLLSWDPEGSTNLFHNDEPAMDIMMRGPRTYDWICDLLTPAEREAALKVFRIRATQLYTNLKRRPFESNPWESHAGRTLGFLGEASIVFAGEIPEAREWLDYILNIFYAVYPAWGSDDGGWAEGPGYWSAYMSMVLLFTRALEQATGVDLHRKPFFRNTGYFGLYCSPPGSKMSPFGDGEHGGIGRGGGNVVFMLSTVARDPYLRWYARESGSATPGGVVGLGWRDETVPARAPVDLPQARYFPRIGWAAMHSALYDGASNIHFMMKSSPYGAASHSHADQNAFVLHAFGEPLAIATGYYPWYGSPHHSGWTRETKAHNAITLNGEGQVQRSRSANGRIAAFFTGPGYHYAVGDATASYGGRATRALRHALFVRSGYVVLFDDVATRDPATAEWWLHSLQQMREDPGHQEVRIRQGEAGLRVSFLEPAGLKLTQTSGFEPKPEGSYADQWHLAATTGTKAGEHRFLTVLYPHRRADEATLPAVARIDAENGVAARVGDGVVLFRRPGAVSTLRAGDLKADASVAALTRSGAHLGALFLAAGTRAAVSDQVYLESSVPVTLSVLYDGDGALATVQMSSAGTVRLRTERKPAQAVVDGKELAASGWRWERGCVVLPLAAGEHEVELNGERRDLKAGSPAVTLEVGKEKTALVALQGADRTVATGTFGGPTGRYRVQVSGGKQPARVSVGSASLAWKPGDTPAELLLMRGAAISVTLEGRRPPRALTITLEQVGMSLSLRPEATVAQQPPAGILVEAEAFAKQGGGEVTLSRGEHAGTHGEGCLYNWGPIGHWLEWEVRVPKAGRYRLSLAAASQEPEAFVGLAVDGREPLPGASLLAIPGTGGWGRTDPKQWRLFPLTGIAPLTLSEGKHTLRLTNIQGVHLNLDYLVLATEGQ